VVTRFGGRGGRSCPAGISRSRTPTLNPLNKGSMLSKEGLGLRGSRKPVRTLLRFGFEGIETVFLRSGATPLKSSGKRGGDFPTEILADFHAKANVDVRTCLTPDWHISIPKTLKPTAKAWVAERFPQTLTQNPYHCKGWVVMGLRVPLTPCVRVAERFPKAFKPQLTGVVKGFHHRLHVVRELIQQCRTVSLHLISL
jgi:hypothetical protein